MKASPPIKCMQQWFEMISVQVGQKCLWLWMTATHVCMWEWLEDKLLFNSVLIGRGVIALCFFFLFFFPVSQQLLTDVVVGSEWMTDSGFSGGWEKKQTKRTVFVWSLPLTTSPSPSLLGELVKIAPPSLPSPLCLLPSPPPPLFCSFSSTPLFVLQLDFTAGLCIHACL